MKLKHVLKNLPFESNLPKYLENLEIIGIADNSMEVADNFLFIAVKGIHTDGHDYIEEAIANGAAIIIGEKPMSYKTSIPYLQVDNSRKAVGQIAKNFYNNPAANKTMVGITGTNGKTTTSYLIKHLLENSGKTCTLIGTIENIINGEVFHSYNTTPSALVLQKILAESKDEVVIMEVSSHGLSQHRVEGIEFDYCLFTNLDHEHLDYHETMDNYFQTKLLLFDYLKKHGKAIVNSDNPWGEKLANILKMRRIPVYSIGKAPANQMQIRSFNNSTIEFSDNNDLIQMKSPIAGVHNMYNILMAYTCATLFGINKSAIMSSLSKFRGVNGRFEMFKHTNGATIIVDYAHTQDAVLHCLTTAKQFSANHITHIFGFRGDRDISKRKEMLTVSSILSDRYILTFDDLNSMSESAMTQQLNQLQTNYGNEKGRIITDRTLAIQWAMENSHAQDWILITGKGHEKYKQLFQLPTESDKETVLYVMEQNYRKHFQDDDALLSQGTMEDEDFEIYPN
ncbi:UDP-N-acetylmuramoyl-L-alanyl-D-glutamate--2,6-diaminopimelate ligase [Caldibacillus lycopersici]|uniref:UDP-N-acetylmuramyl-tripeptide synthetase n=1 Tax=Perspicuibacillus lycopersici TaxID=1325689 RepID=A0AAE3IU60_9BACI|nr:UDP-N-acetylmuramoyl-L-alanyl-D-glutamate--2,6-diaminopimelate ligase [Perspicuibacillus lycopersici]MCU9612869.1 UDP-N-acetylmuramoyl-L-alanyl-D-glutamate--2,6-diaminopimelate ligase [Perspicuibacillus lycopersici]